MKKKKILIFIDWFLPGYKAGGPIVSVSNIIERLCGEFDFTIVTSDRDFGDPEPYKNIEFNKVIKRSNYKIVYLSPTNQNKEFYRSLINDLDFDIVYFNSLFSVNFTLTPLKIIKRARPDVKVILAPRGMLGAGALNIKKRKKQLFLLYAKFSGLFKNIYWQATDETERQDIKTIFGQNSNVYFVQNIPDKPKEYISRKKNITKFIFISRISGKKNLLFAIKLFQNITTNSVEFSIYGTNEDEKYIELCRKEADEVSSNVKIEFKGELEHFKIHDVLSEYHFFILPTFHENFGHSIFEAFSAGCPVLISDQTPWRNLEEKKAGWDLPLNDESLWIDKLNELIKMSNDEYQQWSSGARKLAEEYVNSPELLEGYSKMF